MGPIIDIEIYIKAKNAGCCKDTLVECIKNYIFSNTPINLNEKIVDDLLPNTVEFIRVCCEEKEVSSLEFDKNKEQRPVMNNHFAVLEEDSGIEEVFNDGEDMDGGTTASNNRILPCRELDGTWESLFFATDTKQRLLQYASTSLQLGKKGVNPNIILCNRLILLHGPPGTGKTTICKSLAQKLSVRLSTDYHQTHLVEVNCHNLFSKWFSESGKLVSKMFSMIRQYALDPQVLVVVVIDEVESLTVARKSAISSSEPSDAIRVVNAVLTQLDALRFQRNVLVLATSNLTEAIDDAFSDRADIIQHVGLPDVVEIDHILKSCCLELVRAKVLQPFNALDDDYNRRCLATQCLGLSGRTIRKLPLMAFAESPEDIKDSSQFYEFLFLSLRRLRQDRKAFE